MSGLKVALDGRRLGETGGGVEAVMEGLISGLAALPDGDETYLVLSYAHSAGWLAPYRHSRVQPLLVTAPLPVRLKAILGRIGPVLRRDLWQKLTRPFGWAALQRLATSDGTLERSGAHLVHFLRQDAFLTQVPSIYHPHDLQHRHLPEFFTSFERKARDRAYQAFCSQASLVAVTATWGKRDLIEEYGLPQAKIDVVPWAPPVQAYPKPTEEDLRRVQREHQLPEAYVFYAAQTWPHKNHLGLIEALAWIRNQTRALIPLVTSGRWTEHYVGLKRAVARLGMQAQVQFLGYVPPVDLSALYRLARCVVIPTKFEAASAPLWEAFATGVPAGCSRVTSLPDQARGAALLFEPDKPEEIAQVILRLWHEEGLRRDLVARGRARVAQFTWDRTAHRFRAHYRRIAGRDFTEQDRALLAEAPGI